jgi:hypothetical protein
MPIQTVSQAFINEGLGSFNFRNRIINGAMVIDQRNAGASVTPSNTNYTLDRWQSFLSGGGAYSVQQSTNAPAGFTNSLLVTTTTADASIEVGDYYILTHKIEGFNTADLSFGSATAKTITLSFWVRSSLTGVFSGALNNSAGDRSYPFIYTISSANTWEQKSITISGDTTGTWVTDNGRGIVLRLSLGMGSTYSGTTGVWAPADYYSSTSETAKVIGTLSATFYITGVQLEEGSVATPFERRPYGTELALCQRYLPAYRATGGGNQDIASGLCISSTACYFGFDFVVQPRVEPTGVSISSAGHFGAVNNAFSATNMFTGLSFSVASTKRAVLTGTGSSGLVQGNATFVRSQNSDAYMLFTGCEL